MQGQKLENAQRKSQAQHSPTQVTARSSQAHLQTAVNLTHIVEFFLMQN